jgi:hypothetical protein
MGYDLERNDGAEWGTTSAGWRLILHLAETFGWGPTGTLPPEGASDSTWSGSYFDNCGQLVSTVDAIALAEAIRNAIASPSFDRMVTSNSAEYAAELAAHSTPTVKLSARPFPPDEWRRAAEEFAAFCGGGAFRIY